MVSAACPNCGEVLTDTEGFVPWCPACDYNVDPGRDAATSRDQQRSADEFEHSAASRAPAAVRSRRGFVYIIAGLVHGLTLATLLAGVAILVQWFPAPLGWIGGFLVAAAIVMRPRLGRPPRNLTRVNLAATPAFSEMLASIAGRLGTRQPSHVYLAPDFNMSFGKVGLRRRGVLTIGVPLWMSITPEQRLAALAHELGHAVNQDSRRTVFVGGAIDALATWHDVLHPGRWPHGASASEYVGYILLGPPRLLLAWLAGRAAMALHSLTHERQRAAEFYADRLAATVAGREATASALDALEIGDSVTSAMNAGRRRGDDVLDAMATFVDSIPDHERERLRRRSRRRGTAVDDSHPPTADRVEAVRRWRPDDAYEPLDYDPEVDAELAPLLRSQEPRVRDYLSKLPA